ncbi:MAG: hypothetical protein ACKO2L_22255, partial [Planctomycetaceae bacterium]
MPGASAQPLSRWSAAGQPLVSRWSAAWRQPAGKRACQRPANVLASVRTFGAKHSRGLPPNRSAAWFSRMLSRMAAAGGQTALQTFTNALASARTFG